MLRRMWARQTLAEAFSPVDNSFGFLRLVFAFAVLVSHSYPLGYGRDDPGEGISNGQLELGHVGIVGFFVISGFLITRSGLRFPFWRFLWHRALRILPGLWACLVVTALVLAPLVALLEHGSLAGFWSHPQGPFAYIANNLFVAVGQYGISDLLLSTPYGQRIGSSAFDGSLWSLVYEVMCYFMVAGLAVVGVLRRAKAVVVALAGVGFGIMVYDLVRSPHIPGPQGTHGPVLGFDGLDLYSLVYLTYVFLLGALLELYRHRVPLNDGWAAVATVVLAGTLQFGGFAVLGYPAFAYLVLWLAIRLPRRLRDIGRRQDYSYGFYIYAFPVQQLLALVGVPDWGMIIYIALATAGTVAFAVPSWHLVERRAMALKNWTPSWRMRMPARRRPRHAAAVVPVGSREQQHHTRQPVP